MAKEREQRTVERPSPPSIIGVNVQIKGNLCAAGDVQIDGAVDGNVSSRVLNISEKAVINGAIIADTVRIAGMANGEITARIVQLNSTASVTGNISHQCLSIEPGAFVEGLCRHVEMKNVAQQVSSITDSDSQIGYYDRLKKIDVQPDGKGNEPDPRPDSVKVVD